MKKDITVKLDVYERAGVREYWVVHPGDQSIMIYRLGNDGTYPEDPEIAQLPGVARSGVLEGLEVKLPVGE